MCECMCLCVYMYVCVYVCVCVCVRVRVRVCVCIHSVTRSYIATTLPSGSEQSDVIVHVTDKF